MGKKEYLSSPHQVPGDYFPRPYSSHLYDLVERAGRLPPGHAAEFRLYNEWEAEYVKEQMLARYPDVKYRMRWMTWPREPQKG